MPKKVWDEVLDIGHLCLFYKLVVCMKDVIGEQDNIFVVCVIFNMLDHNHVFWTTCYDFCKYEWEYIQALSIMHI